VEAKVVVAGEDARGRVAHPEIFSPPSSK